MMIKIFRITVVCLVMACLSIAVYAQDNPSAVGMAPILPDNQNKDVSYFDLLMEPGQEQTVYITLMNSSNDDMNILLQLTYATSSIYDTIQYTEMDESKKDITLKHPLTSIASFEKDVYTIGPNSSVKVPIHLKMPDEPLNGVILGGITAKKVSEANVGYENEISISNEYVYIVGMVLRENNEELIPDLIFSPHSTVSFTDKNIAITANLHNPQPIIMKYMNMTMDFHKKGSDKILHTVTKESVMAPNSNMDYVYNWEDPQVRTGDYTMDVSIAFEDQVWKHSYDFTIDSDHAVFFHTPFIEPTPMNIVLLIICVNLLLIVIIMIILFIRRRKRM